MSIQLDVKYICQHPSCLVVCKEGIVTLGEGEYNELSFHYEDADIFRSPRETCRLGFAQPFKALSIVKVDRNPGDVIRGRSRVVEEPKSEDPIGFLIAEHKDLLKKVELIEGQIRRRDMDALWASTTELENHLHVHSVVREEEVLFPALTGLLPYGETLVAIIKEEHREVVNILHNFREALEDGVLQDSIIVSMIVSLKSHIRKEDGEFFELVRKHVDDISRMNLVDAMKMAEQTYLPIPVTPRPVRSPEEKAARQRREKIDEAFLVNKEVCLDSCCN
jgi:hemerythrin-like domain-containing protein